MCPQHLKPSLPPEASGGRWPNGRSTSASKHQVWRPYKPREELKPQEQPQNAENGEIGKSQEKQASLLSIEAEVTGPLDFGPPDDLCPKEGSFPRQLLQQKAALIDAAPSASKAAAPVPQTHFCLPPPASEEGGPQPAKEPEEDAVWPPLTNGPPVGKKQKGGPARQPRQQQQRLKSNKRAQQEKDENTTAGERALLSSPTPCRAPPSSPASGSPAVVESVAKMPAAPTPPPGSASTETTVRAPPGLSGPDVQSALLRASFLGRTDIVKLCLERGASPAAADSIGRTPLHYAAATGVAEAVALLLKYAANADQREDKSSSVAVVDLADKKRWTPLLIAVTKEHVACVKLLLGAGANAQHLLCHRCAPCRGSSNGGVAANASTQSKAAAESSSEGPEEAPVESENGQEAVQKQSVGSSNGTGEASLQTWSAAIHFAAIKGSIPISELLLQHGSTVNDLDSDCRPPLHYAACRDKPDYVKWLLQKGARPDLLDVNQRTVFHAAATRGNLQVVQLLLEATPPKTLLRLLLQQDVWALSAEALAKLHGHRPMHLLLKSYREAVESQMGLEEAAAAATSRAVGAQSLSDSAVSATIAEVLATGLQELKKAKLVRAVQRLGTLPCLKAYQQTLMIQALGGMLVADGSRRKTAGGVFFTILNEFAKEGQISREDLAFVNAEDCETRKAIKRRARQVADSSSRSLLDTAAATASAAPLRVAPETRSHQQEQRREKKQPRQQQLQEKNSQQPQSHGQQQKQQRQQQQQAQEQQQQRQQQQGKARRQQHQQSSRHLLPPQQQPRHLAQVEEDGSAASTPSACSYASLVAAIANEAVQSATQSPSSASHAAAVAAAAPQQAFGYPMYPITPYWPVGFPGPLSPPSNMFRPSSSWNAATAAAHQQQLAAAVAASSAMNFATSPLALQQAVVACAAQQQQQLQHGTFAAVGVPSLKRQQKNQVATNVTKPRRAQAQKNPAHEETATSAAAVGEASSQRVSKASSNGKAQQQSHADTQLLLERIRQQQIQLEQQKLQLEQLQQQQRQAQAAAKGSVNQTRLAARGKQPSRAQAAKLTELLQQLQLRRATETTAATKECSGSALAA